MRATGSLVRLPGHSPGMRIGLYGGTFNPPHLGHRHVALVALKRLRLDRIWWAVTPGNPLKNRAGLASAAERLAATRQLAWHPRMAVTDFETRIGSNYTIDTVRFLTSRLPHVELVWIMGADSLSSFHRWDEWREIARLVPLAVVDRPGWTLRAMHSPAATALAPYRWPEEAAARLPGAIAPAWTFLHGPRSSLSSTALRETGGVSIAGR